MTPKLIAAALAASLAGPAMAQETIQACQWVNDIMVCRNVIVPRPSPDDPLFRGGGRLDGSWEARLRREQGEE